MANEKERCLYCLQLWRECEVDRRYRHETDIGLPDVVLSDAREKIAKRYTHNEIPQGIAKPVNERGYLINGCLVAYITGGPGVSHITHEPVIRFWSESNENLERLLQELELKIPLKLLGENKK